MPMDNVTLEELPMKTRKDALVFLKRLWKEESVPCPFCSSVLEPLHKKAKKSTNDWQCRTCGKIYRTIRLLDEINERMPD